MNSYEIEIFNISDDTEMNTIQEALQQAGISDAGDKEVGMYLRDNKPCSVFVDPSEVSEAVQILHSLGYETDEDEYEEE